MTVELEALTAEQSAAFQAAISPHVAAVMGRDNAYSDIGYKNGASLAQALDPALSVSTRLSPMLPGGFSPRSGVVWALLDKVKRKLRYVDSAGAGWSNIPERFNKGVKFFAGLSAEGQRITNLALPATGTDAVSLDRLTTERAAIDATLVPSTLVTARVGPMLPAGFSARSGVAWALLDSARRKLRFIDRSGIGWSNIPERFNGPVQFNGSVGFSTPLVFNSQKLGTTTLTYLKGYDRSGWIWTRIDSARRVMIGVRKDGRAWAGGKKLATVDELANVAPSATYIPALLKPNDKIADAWGDSLTAIGAGSDSYGDQLTALLGGGFVYNNYGIGGQKSTQIAMRMGAIATYLTVTGNALPAGGTAVAITAINGQALAGMNTAADPDYRLLSTPAENNTRSITGYLAGKHGTLTRTASGSSNPSTGEAYSWVSDAAEAAIACPAGTLFVPDAMLTTRDRELWICVGRNNYTQVDQVKADIAAMIALGRKTHKRILLWSVLNGSYGTPGQGETAGGSGWATIRQLNYDLRMLYPRYYVVDSRGRDLRERLVASGNGSTQDLADLANDIPPTSLRSDAIHTNAAGRAVWAQLGYEFRTANVV